MRQVIITIAAVLWPIMGLAQADVPSIFDLMGGVEVRTIQLSFPLDTLVNNRRMEEKLPGKLTFIDRNHTKRELEVKIGLRGKFRRQKCTDLPPFKLDFKKKDLKAAGLADFDDYKLVNFCKGDKAEAEMALINEYLTYQMYRQLTDASFRVQLLEVIYKDTQTGHSFKQKAFIIEDGAELRDRIGANKSKAEFGITQSKLHPEYQQTAALFQYMIGNNDWNFTSSKNVKLYEKDGFLIPVPYDFDFAVIVNAPYLKFGQISETARKSYRQYQGFEKDVKMLEAGMQHFKDKKADIENVIQSSALLSDESKTAVIGFIQHFYHPRATMKFQELAEQKMGE